LNHYRLLHNDRLLLNSDGLLGSVWVSDVIARNFNGRLSGGHCGRRGICYYMGSFDRGDLVA